MQNDIALQIREFIKDNFMFGTELSLDDRQSLIDAGVIDSTGVLELVSFLEDRFAIVIPDADIVPENLDSLEAIVAYTRRKLPSATVAA
jgi:acyl carrier protein